MYKSDEEVGKEFKRLEKFSTSHNFTIVSAYEAYHFILSQRKEDRQQIEREVRELALDLYPLANNPEHNKAVLKLLNYGLKMKEQEV